MRGRHIAPFTTVSDARQIAGAFRNAIYEEEQRESYFGIPLTQFAEIIRQNRIVWAPDGGAAFDNSSYVLQFDVEDKVRIVAFRSAQSRPYHPATLRDIYLAADDFYIVLQKWYKAFEVEWASAAKKDSHSSDGL